MSGTVLVTGDTKGAKTAVSPLDDSDLETVDFDTDFLRALSEA